MEHTGYPLYFPPSEMSFYWRRWPRRCKRRLPTSSRSLSISPFLSLSLSLSLSPSVFRGKRLQSRSGESFRKSLEEAYRRGGAPFVHRHLDFTSCANPTATRLCLSFCLSLSIMGFRRSLANYRNPVYRVNSFLWYYGLIIMQRISPILCPRCLLPFFPSLGSGPTLRAVRKEGALLGIREFERVY